MRKVSPVAALVLAGCFAPSVEEGATCSPDGECPPGQTCADDGRCYAADPSFRFRRRIDLNPPGIGGVLRDFPVAIALTGDPGLTAHAADDGLDIHFLDGDGASELAFEVESFDRAAGDLVAWVRVPVLSAEDSIYLEYGGDPALRPPPADVWAERYLAVWHGSAGDDLSLADSTGNHNDGRSGDGQAPDRVAGAVGSALSFDGTDDEVVIDEAVPLVQLGADTSILLSMWVQLGATAADGASALGRGAQSGNEAGFGVQLGSGNWILRLRGAGSGDTMFASFGSGSALAGRWVLLGATIVSQEKGQQAYQVTTSVDGEEVGAGYWVCEIGPCGLDLGGPLTFSHPDARFAGLIDEVRIVDRSLGPENLRAQFDNLAVPETFYTVGDEETLPL